MTFAPSATLRRLLEQLVRLQPPLMSEQLLIGIVLDHRLPHNLYEVRSHLLGRHLIGSKLNGSELEFLG